MLYLTTASEVAECIIHFCAEHGDSVTNLKLQKLLYYCQAWYLAIHGEPLFKDSFEAWVHGPAIPHVYGDYKKHGFDPIPNAVKSKTKCKDIPRSVMDHVAEVLKVYSRYSGYDLERLTHEEEPWIKARKGLPRDASSHNKISNEDMKRFYGARLKDGKR